MSTRSSTEAASSTEGYQLYQKWSSYLTDDQANDLKNCIVLINAYKRDNNNSNFDENSKLKVLNSFKMIVTCQEKAAEAKESLRLLNSFLSSNIVQATRFTYHIQYLEAKLKACTESKMQENLEVGLSKAKQGKEFLLALQSLAEETKAEFDQKIFNGLKDHYSEKVHKLVQALKKADLLQEIENIANPQIKNDLLALLSNDSLNLLPDNLSTIHWILVLLELKERASLLMLTEELKPMQQSESEIVKQVIAILFVMDMKCHQRYLHYEKQLNDCEKAGREESLYLEMQSNMISHYKKCIQYITDLQSMIQCISHLLQDCGNKITDVKKAYPELIQEIANFLNAADLICEIELLPKSSVKIDLNAILDNEKINSDNFSLADLYKCLYHLTYGEEYALFKKMPKFQPSIELLASKLSKVAENFI